MRVAAVIVLHVQCYSIVGSCNWTLTCITVHTQASYASPRAHVHNKIATVRCSAHDTIQRVTSTVFHPITRSCSAAHASQQRKQHSLHMCTKSTTILNDPPTEVLVRACIDACDAIRHTFGSHCGRSARLRHQDLYRHSVAVPVALVCQSSSGRNGNPGSVLQLVTQPTKAGIRVLVKAVSNSTSVISDSSLHSDWC